MIVKSALALLSSDVAFVWTAIGPETVLAAGQCPGAVRGTWTRFDVNLSCVTHRLSVGVS